MFVGVVLLIAGFFVAPPQGFVMVAVGLVLGSLAGLELTIREHFAGYRSHTLLLSAAVGVPVFGVLFAATKVPVPICLAAGPWRSGAPPGSSPRPSGGAPAEPPSASGAEGFSPHGWRASPRGRRRGPVAAAR